jgi:periplasmic protein TonB
MNFRKQAITISLTLHSTVLFLFYALTGLLAHQEKPILIDLTIADSAQPAAPKPKTAQAPKKNEPVSTKITNPTKAVRSYTQLKQLEPAVEPKGDLPVISRKTDMPSPPPAQTAMRESSPVSSGHPGSVTTSQASGNETSGDQLRGRYKAEHFAYIRKIIQENLTYPPRARRMGWAGKAVVTFEVLKNGRVKDIRIQTSTGFELLDTNVVETINRVEPFPQPPIPVVLKIPVSYGLE